MVVFGSDGFRLLLNFEHAHEHFPEPLIIRFFLKLEIPDVIETLSELFY